MKVTSKINTKGMAQFYKLATESLADTADAIITDLKRSKTVPKDTGELERTLNVDSSKKGKGIVTIQQDGPYARRLYFHPEYNFHQEPWTSIEKGKKVNHGSNANAGGEWFEPYISGSKKDYASKVFARIMRGKMK